MSKQSDAKKEQGYAEKPVFPMCSNCVHFKSDIVVSSGRFGDWRQEKNIRCGVGGFAVKKQGNCRMHKLVI